jgi:methylenetetrahydrofolate reductase (NADPH)
MPAMRISEIYSQQRRVFSFEFFPPKTDEGFQSLYRTIEKLKNRGPGFVSVTWGAGGSTRRKTVDLVIEIQRELGITAMAHLSCVDSTREQIEKTLDQLEAGGIENVLALTGDHPPGYTPQPESFQYANELSAFIESRWNFDVSGACYPETHPLSPSPEIDLENLIRKANTGMKVLITQLFFDNDCYFEFVERLRAAGLEQPIVPGIMPIISASNFKRITSLSGSRIPAELEAQLSEVEDDDAETMEVGVAWAMKQCGELLSRGAPGIHFYTMNKSPATRRIFESLMNR